MTTTPTTGLTPERADLLDLYAFQRSLLMSAVDAVSGDQARERSTVSELTLGGIVKHLAAVESGWMDFVEHGPSDDETSWDGEPSEEVVRAFLDGFRLLDGETLDGVVADYWKAAARTDDLIRTVDLDQAHPLPKAPWFPAGVVRSNRRVFQGMAVELAQHTGHTDIIREAIDGKKSMG